MDHFLRSLYWLYYNISSILCFCFWLQDMWDLSYPTKLAPSVLEGKLLTTELPRKSLLCFFYWYFFTNRKILIMCLINFSWKLDNKLKLIERIWGLGWFVFLLWGFAFPSGLYLAIQNNLNWILRPEMIWGARAGIFLNSLSVLLFRVPIWIMRTYQSPPL